MLYRSIQQGFIERSNVSLVDEMVQLITLQLGTNEYERSFRIYSTKQFVPPVDWWRLERNRKTPFKSGVAQR